MVSSSDHDRACINVLFVEIVAKQPFYGYNPHGHVTLLPILRKPLFPRIGLGFVLVNLFVCFVLFEM